MWRLETEKRQRKDGSIRVLVLKDLEGKVQRVAESFFEREEVRKWWRNYNRSLSIEELPASKRLRKKLKLMIGNLRREGFIYREVCFGTYRNWETGKHEYKRIEIYKETRWTRAEFFRISEFFKRHVLKESLGIFVINNNKLYMYPITGRPVLESLRLILKL